MSACEELKNISKKFAKRVSEYVFSIPVAAVYNPLEYACLGYAKYLEVYGCSAKKIIFLGMNPGPWGMAQTGIPFGEINAVRNFLQIEEKVSKPDSEHFMRPVEGYACKRSEVSGRRLWGLFAERYGSAVNFFDEHFVANYCPLVFMNERGGNITPDKLAKKETEELYEDCDNYLRDCVRIMEVEWVVGVGGFAEERARVALDGMDVQIGRILHPSPASPAANRNWAGVAEAQMIEMGLWKGR